MAITNTANLKLQKIDSSERLSAYPAVQAANADKLDSYLAGLCPVYFYKTKPNESDVPRKPALVAVSDGSLYLVQ